MTDVAPVHPLDADHLARGCAVRDAASARRGPMRRFDADRRAAGAR